MKPFRIFRPGKHRASCGTVVEFTEADLKRAVSVYSPALYAAPLVIGHPKTEDRAYGWAESLTYENGHVVVHPDKVNPEFGELVEQGAYRNRSASWYMPDHPSNPSPGNLYPKHIGFLGAVPPALKGLGDVQFNDSAAPVDFAAETHPDLVVEFGGDDDAWSLANFMTSTASMLRKWRDTLLAEKGVEVAEETVPAWQITDLERQAMRQEERARNAQTMPFNESTPNPEEIPVSNSNTTPTNTPPALTTEQIADLQRRAQAGDAAVQQVQQYQERETSIAAAERMATVATIDANLAPLVQAGKVLPKFRSGLANFMADLPDDEGARTIEFGEAVEGQPKPKVSPRAFMRQFLESLPKAVHFGELAGNTTENAGALTPAQLAAKATTIRNKAVAEGRSMSFTEATNLAMAEAGVTVANPDNTPQV